MNEDQIGCLLRAAWNEQPPNDLEQIIAEARRREQRHGLSSGGSRVAFDVVRRWKGRSVLDCDDQRIGSVIEVYYDAETDQPGWALVDLDQPNGRSSLVPLANATELDESVRVPYERETVRRAPGMPPTGRLWPQDEAALYRYYDLDYTGASLVDLEELEDDESHGEALGVITVVVGNASRVLRPHHADKPEHESGPQ